MSGRSRRFAPAAQDRRAAYAHLRKSVRGAARTTRSRDRVQRAILPCCAARSSRHRRKRASPLSKPRRAERGDGFERVRRLCQPVEKARGCRRSRAGQKLDNAEARDPVTCILQRRKASTSLICAASRNLRPPNLTKGILRRASSISSGPLWSEARNSTACCFSAMPARGAQGFCRLQIAPDRLRPGPRQAADARPTADPSEGSSCDARVPSRLQRWPPQ